MNSFFQNIIILFVLTTFFIHAQDYSVDKGKLNEIRFYAEATFNNFEGSTRAVDGFLVLNSKNKNFDFRVMLDSLDTGIGLRNKHLRGYLNTDKYPSAEFKGTSVQVDSINSIEYLLKAAGSFSINNVSKNLSVTGKLYSYGELKKLEANFELKLSDFNIERPTFLFNKVHNQIILKIIIYLKEG